MQRDAAAVRAEHFQRVAQAPLAPLLAAGDAVLPAVHSAHELPLADVGGAVGGLLGLLAAKVEARRIVAVAGAGQLGQHLVRQLKVVVHRVGQILIQCAAVGSRHAGNVVERLGAALDLQAVYARLADEVQERCRAHVVGVQDIAPVLVLADLIQLAGAGLLAQVVFPAAGLGALAPVGVAARQIVGQQAPARHAHAHGTVDKGLDLQFRRGLIPDGGNVLQGQLTGQHHPFSAQVVGRTGSGPVGDAGLGGHVDINIRRELLAGFQHTQVCHDEGIHARCGRAPDGVRQTVGLFVGGQGVHGQIDLAAAGMGVDDALGQLFRCEVGRG